MLDNIIILKIGGSSITNKGEEETLDPKALEWFAKLIASSASETHLSSNAAPISGYNGDKPKAKFIIVHGAGSFGHHSAKRFGFRCGKSVYLEETACINQQNNNAIDMHCQLEGLSKTRYSVQKLNSAIVGALLHHGVNAVGISPGLNIPSIRAHGATARAGDKSDRDESYQGMKLLCQAIHQCLQAGLLPVIHGDACLLYDDKRGGILGGDTLVEGIATIWQEINTQSSISKVVFITDVAGVFTSDPKSNDDAVLIRHLNVNSKNGEICIVDKKVDVDDNASLSVRSLEVGGSSHAHDVTGGLKVRGMNLIVSILCNRKYIDYILFFLQILIRQSLVQQWLLFNLELM